MAESVLASGAVPPAGLSPVSLAGGRGGLEGRGLGVGPLGGVFSGSGSGLVFSPSGLGLLHHLLAGGVLGDVGLALLAGGGARGAPGAGGGPPAHLLSFSIASSSGEFGRERGPLQLAEHYAPRDLSIGAPTVKVTGGIWARAALLKHKLCPCSLRLRC